jgi:hypothetical protein
MPLRRAFRRWLSGWLMLAILFTQIATAAYACPMLLADRASDAGAAMPCMEMMSKGAGLDADQLGLCIQHCQFGSTQQPAEALQVLVADVPALVALFTVAPVIDQLLTPASLAARQHGRAQAPEPPLSIRLCCFRI